ncbi:hypothetical protein [Henriciella marina]|uniref:hypothetical protein n=1 Tax=Henriciella marina TaxID=453851 RepID=UPI00037DC806|nr:hypothetical protein [Henriciella marina]
MPDTRILAGYVLQRIPQTLRLELMQDSNFATEINPNITPTISPFENVSFKVDEFFEALRCAVRNVGQKYNLETRDGRKAKIVVDEQFKASCVVDEVTLQLPESRLLSDDIDTKLTGLKALAYGKLPSERYETWERRITDEVSFDLLLELYEDCQNSPVGVMEQISGLPEKGSAPWTLFLPHCDVYWQRLVGDFSLNGSVDECASQGIVAQLERWKGLDEPARIKQSLSLCGQSQLSDVLASTLNIYDHLDEVVDWVLLKKAPITVVGLTELLLANLCKYSGFQERIGDLVHAFIEMNPDKGRQPSYTIAANLFAGIDGLSARFAKFQNVSIFYRRYVVSTQATLIHSELGSDDELLASISESLFAHYSQNYLLKTLLETVETPSWHVDGLTTNSLYADHAGRLFNKASLVIEHISCERLKTLLFGDSGSLQSDCLQMASFRPGYLEGSQAPTNLLPVDLHRAIDEQLKLETNSARAFVALTNAIPTFAIPDIFVARAKDKIDQIGLFISDVKERYEVWAILGNLARLAVVCGNEDLANSLATLIKRYTNSVEFALNATDAFRLLLLLSAVCRDPEDRYRWIQQQLEFLAFSEFSKEQLVRLEQELFELCAIEPAMRGHLAKSIAAIRYTARQ